MHRIIPSIALAALMGLIACGSTQTPPQPQHLLVTSVMGKVEAWKGEAKTQSVRNGFKLEEQWTIQTSGDDALCLMQTPSGSVIRITGSTTLKLTELYKDGKLAVEKTGLELVAGKILVKARTLSGDDSFSVRTKTAVAGVRGTRFVVSYNEEQGTQVAVESGKVAVAQPVAITLPAGVTNASKEILSALERSTEVMVTPNEAVKITREDNLATQKAVESVVKDTITTDTALKPEAVRAAVVKIQAKLEAAPIALPAKRVISDEDKDLKKDFETVKTLAVVTPPEAATNKLTGATKTDNDKKNTKVKTNEESKATVTVPQPQIIKRDKEDVNPEERF